MARAWPLVGRDDVVDSALALVRAGRSVAVCGAAGVGKTRVAAEVVSRYLDSGRSCRSVFATRSASDIPLGALAPVLAIDRSGQATHDALAAAVHELAADTPSMVHVDDAHSLDDASATVIHRLASATDVAVILTVRDGEDAPAATLDLLRSDAVERVEVEPLGEEQMGELVGEALGGPVDGLTLKALWRPTQGNPLYVRELVLGAVETGLLEDTDGVWHLTRRLTATPQLAEVVRARFDDLDLRLRRAIEVVAFGEPLGLATLTELADADAVDELERRRVLSVEASRRRRLVRLSHPMYGEVVRDTISVTRRDEVTRSLFDALVGSGARRQSDPLRLAVLAQSCGAELDEQLLTDGARRALHSGSADLAVELLSGVGERVGIEAGLVRADALAAAGRAEEAVWALQEIADLPADDRQRSLHAKRLANIHFWALGDEAAAFDTVAERLEALPRSSAWHHELSCYWGTLEVVSGRLFDAVERCARFVESDGRPMVEAATAMAPALAIMGRTTDAAAIADRAYEISSAHPDEAVSSSSGLHIVSRCLAMGEAGELGAAAELATFGYDVAASRGLVVGQAWMALILGRVLSVRELDAAARWYAESVSSWRQARYEGATRWALGGATLIAAWRGEGDAACVLADEFDRLGGRCLAMMDPDLDRARAWADLASGADVDRTLDGLVGAADRAQAMGAHTLELAALHDAVRIGCHQAVDDRLRAAAARVDGPLAQARLGHLDAAANDDASGLEGAGRAFEESGADVLAAEAFAMASAAADDHATVRRLSSRARAVADRAGGVATPAMMLATEAARLTKRELEIARLAVAGMSNPDIADQLVVSVRTVANHLQRCYEKLGVNRREQLADVLG